MASIYAAYFSEDIYSRYEANVEIYRPYIEVFIHKTYDASVVTIALKCLAYQKNNPIKLGVFNEK